MAYSRGNDAVDDFDEYDPTPYGGGYDLALNYGRPLDPCEEICHPISSTSTSSYGDYERPNLLMILKLMLMEKKLFRLSIVVTIDPNLEQLLVMVVVMVRRSLILVRQSQNQRTGFNQG